MSIIRIETTTSTNTYLKELAKEQILDEGTAVITESQTEGKGQRGNAWESEPGKNITFSIILYPDFLPVRQNFLLSKVVALGIRDVLDSYVDNITIKWPNDIYYEKRKMVGILIENEWMGQNITQSIAGIGINVNQDVFLSNAPNPVSLKQILGRDLDLNILLDGIIKQIMLWYGRLKAGDIELISKSYQEALYRNSGYHRYKDSSGLFTASLEKVTDDGFLHLITDAGEERSYAFKEVSFII